MEEEILRHIDDVLGELNMPRRSSLIFISPRMLDAGLTSIDIDGPTAASDYRCSALWIQKLYSAMRSIEITETQNQQAL